MPKTEHKWCDLGQPKGICFCHTLPKNAQKIPIKAHFFENRKIGAQRKGSHSSAEEKCSIRRDDRGQLLNGAMGSLYSLNIPIIFANEL